MDKPRLQSTAKTDAADPHLIARHKVWWPACVTAILMWMAQPPLGFSLLAWIAPVGLLWIIDRPQSPGKSGYFYVWLAGCVYWLAILQGIRLAYWPLYFGWLALSLYLAIYFPVFVGITRHLVQRCRWPLMLAAPLVWTGCELWRSYLLTGYAASTLAHSQFHQPIVIQLADQVGGYGIGLVMMCAAVLAYRLISWKKLAKGPRVWEVAMASGLVGILLGYGAWRLNESQVMAKDARPLLRIALIQENTPSMFDADPGRLVVAWDRYAEMTGKALQAAGHASGKPVDVVVWPESTFTGFSTEHRCGITWMENKIVSRVPEEVAHMDRLSLDHMVSILQDEFSKKVAVLHATIAAASSGNDASAQVSTDAVPPPYLLVGNDTLEFTDEQVGKYNAALLVDPRGQVVNRYNKIHLVMFGEYVPLGSLLKPVADMFGLVCTHGTTAKSFEVKGVKLAPSICFESMLPQVMSWLLRSLKAEGEDPHVLINVTNDSWFRGSSMLDHHLACEVLAAVELRRPFLIAANTGLSAWIDGSGRIVEQTERLQPGFIIAEPIADSRFGLTQVWGDLPAWLAAMVVAVAMVHGWRTNRADKKRQDKK